MEERGPVLIMAVYVGVAHVPIKESGPVLIRAVALPQVPMEGRELMVVAPAQVLKKGDLVPTMTLDLAQGRRLAVIMVTGLAQVLVGRGRGLALMIIVAAPTRILSPVLDMVQQKAAPCMTDTAVVHLWNVIDLDHDHPKIFVCMSW